MAAVSLTPTMLIDSIRSLFGQSSPNHQPPPGFDNVSHPAPVHVAACALLLEIAYADGEFSAPERMHLEQVLARHFALSPEVGKQLIEIAEVERRKSIDHFGFTAQLKNNYDIGQKMVLAEVMWGLVLADGQIAEHEHYLMRKIANLLDLEPGYLFAAKAAAAKGDA